jgi:hypothetical protein
MDSDANKPITPTEPEEDINLEVPEDTTANLTINPEKPINSDEISNSDNDTENDSLDFPTFQEEQLNIILKIHLPNI